MKINKICIMICLLLAGCQKASIVLDPPELLDELLPHASGDMLVLEDDQVKDILFIEDETVCIGATSMNKIPSEIMLCTGEDKIVKNLLSDRLDLIRSSAQMYSPETIQIIDDAVIEKKENLWILILDENSTKMKEIIDNYNK